jgi:methionine synthase I (cobalamin-dependent)
MVFNAQGEMLGDSTVTVEEAVRELEDGGALAVGTNCGGTATDMLRVTERLRAATTLPVWVKPHAGLPAMENGRPVYRSDPNEFARNAIALVRAGANFVGGCCGIGPEHIRALAAALAATGSPSP